eukprot:gb/GFBE01055096.1/.p1 GENE.gb/GFBE01055096.1/~~gb/GFBE01055096.1/.p1  ORF type:complete len:143 (+),score=11.37 gb/GFBE01055096.1/:1-429(+)
MASDQMLAESSGRDPPDATPRPDPSPDSESDEDCEQPSRASAFAPGDPLWSEALSLLEVLGCGYGSHRAHSAHSCQREVDCKDGDAADEERPVMRTWAVIQGNPRFSEVLRFLPPKDRALVDRRMRQRGLVSTHALPETTPS